MGEPIGERPEDINLTTYMTPDKNGYFELRGVVKELSRIDPYLYVRHSCKGKEEIYCWIIPGDCINDGWRAKRYCSYLRDLAVKNDSDSRCFGHWHMRFDNVSEALAWVTDGVKRMFSSIKNALFR
ncbi:unnamed protein product [Cylicocyclus nassatus]|uniref:Uncharacterized protein n=1 Tax=Cylicocyclus nassatus TaxID=53992 RepID=A0AA36DUJ8_CYLNA|nr:unnamed protein product [Cylicocyclus nassatus]